MKTFKFIPVAIASLLMVVAVGCTSVRETGDDGYYSSPVNSTAGRIYVDDPYRGTVVLERDPFTGRYYEIGSTYSSRYNSRYNTYDPYYRNNGGYYNNRPVRRTRPVYQTPVLPQQPSQERTKEMEKQRDDARKRILGN